MRTGLALVELNLSGWNSDMLHFDLAGVADWAARVNGAFPDALQAKADQQQADY